MSPAPRSVPSAPTRSAHQPTRRSHRRSGLMAIAAMVIAGTSSLAIAAPESASAELAASETASAPQTTTQADYVPSGWPTHENTGASGELLPMTGQTITRDGTVISDREITGQLTIKADNVVLRNVVVRTEDYFGILTYGDNTRIEDSTVIGTAPQTLAGIAAFESGDFKAFRVEVKGSEDGVRLAHGSVLRGSLIHQLAGSSSSHFDAVTADGYVGWKIVHNTILNQKDYTAAVWVGDSRYGGSAGVLRDNYIAGGGYTIYSGTGDTSGSRLGIRVKDNVFSTRFFPRSGRFGVVYDWRSEGNTWSGNTWIDGPNQGQAILQ